MSTHELETRTRILAATWQLMVERRGQGVRMRDIAEAAGISRQAVYLHFASRTDLLVATTHYGDEIRGLDERVKPWQAATTGLESLEAFVEFWGNYLPEIYGIAKALLLTRETDAAAAAAWNDRMDAVRDGCRQTVEALQRDGILAPEWSREEAIDVFRTLLSVESWEHLTFACGWTTEQYVSRMQSLLKRTFVREP